MKEQNIKKAADGDHGEVEGRKKGEEGQTRGELHNTARHKLNFFLLLLKLVANRMRG